jgi:hypothetical protein
MPGTVACKLHNALSVFAIGAVLFIFGCRKGADIIWKAEARSPNGQWLATAETDQQSGFGTDGATTVVYLRPVNGSRPPVQILSFSQNEHAQTSLIDLNLKWVDETHLDVSYKEQPNLDFQAVKYAGIDISVRNLSSNMTNRSQ